MDKEQIIQLYQKYLDKSLSPEELSAFGSIFTNASDESQFAALIDQDWDNQNEKQTEMISAEKLDQLFYRIVAQPQKTITRKFWPRVAAAASILLTLSTAGYYLLRQNQPAHLAAQKQEQIAPVQNGIILQLGNGQQLVIDQHHAGRSKVADGTQIAQKESSLSYNSAENKTKAAPLTHTLYNNSGNKFSLTLADGTEAYLDAQSSITYPVAFSGKTREVSVTGQAYFKVRHNEKQPFSVKAGNQTIEDIGTEFNIDAYEGNIRTTLVSGLVKVRMQNTANALTIHPGEQAMTVDGQLSASTADLEAATGWLQDKIVFNRQSLEDILAQVSRIYGVQISWQDESLKQLRFGGSVSRTKKLSTVLNFFRKTGKVDFRVSGKTVTVLKKQPDK